MLFSIGKFEGPLDLLLALIRKEEMDIMDINLHKITQQYLNVIKTSNEVWNLEEGGEFIHMASILLYLKSKSLLPQVEEPEEELEISSKESLIEALSYRSEYLKVAEQLSQKEILNRDIWSCPGRLGLLEPQAERIETEGIFSLLKACQKALLRASAYSMKIVFPSTLEWLYRIRSYFVLGQNFSFKKLISFSDQPIIHQVLLSFLSLLELGKLGVVSLSQTDSDIQIISLKSLNKETLRAFNMDSAQYEGSQLK